MTEEILRQNLLEIMRTVLKVPDLSPHAERQAVAQWDSLRNIELIFALEDAFGIEFTAEELETFTSVDAILRILTKKKNAA
ncbi:MAG: acyl carrier protein [Hydrogenophilus sp.]|nr:acyl carrier protein [Hydrogenophilus sp.]